jgi:hypothetical protein
MIPKMAARNSLRRSLHLDFAGRLCIGSQKKEAMISGAHVIATFHCSPRYSWMFKKEFGHDLLAEDCLAPKLCLERHDYSILYNTFFMRKRRLSHQSIQKNVPLI